MRDVVALNSATAITRQAVAEGGVGVHPNAYLASMLDLLVVYAEGGGIWDRIELHASGPGVDAVEKGAGAVCGPGAHLLHVAAEMESSVDLVS
jgi:hypothetical protein